MDIAKLRGQIAAKFKTQTAFAYAIGWNKNKITRMLRGLYNPNTYEVALMIKVLEIPEEQCYEIFLKK